MTALYYPHTEGPSGCCETLESEEGEKVREGRDRRKEEREAKEGQLAQTHHSRSHFLPVTA